jgi:putative membrane protein
MIESIKIFIKGFIVGVANIIPGVSGGTLAISLGIYEKLVAIASHFFKDFKNNLKFLFPLGLGAVVSILSLSKLLSFLLDKYEIPTVMFFIGLILGGVPIVYRKVDSKKITPGCIIVFLITFLSVVIMSLVSLKDVHVDLSIINFIGSLKLFGVGIIGAATMVIPGISGTFVLMLMGYYEPIIDIISDLTSFNHIIHNFLILIPIGLGLVFGIILVAKIIEYLLKKYANLTYWGILGFVVSSMVSIAITLTGFTVANVIVGLILLAIGTVFSYKLSK